MLYNIILLNRKGALDDRDVYEVRGVVFLLSFGPSDFLNIKGENMTKVNELMVEDFAAKKSKAETNLGTVSNLAYYLNQEIERLEDFEEKVKKQKAVIDKLQYVELPEAMQELGLNKVVLDDGSSISVATEYFAAISKKNSSIAYDWLRENNFGDIIKSELKMNFVHDDESREHIANYLDEQNVDYQEKDSVHWQTLRAFVKEQIEAGQPIPMDTFSVHISNKAKLKKEK